MLLLSTSASAQYDNSNGDFQTFTGPIVNENAWIIDSLTNWKVSHGKPTPMTGGGSTDIWMWSYLSANNGPIGEGIYKDFSFTAGNTYELCYDVWRADSSNLDSQIRVEITTGLMENTVINPCSPMTNRDF